MTAAEVTKSFAGLSYDRDDREPLTISGMGDSEQDGETLWFGASNTGKTL